MLTLISTKTLGYLTAIAIAIAAEWTMILAWLVSFIPVKPPDLISQLFERHQPLVVVEYDMWLYRIFILLVIVIAFFGMYVVKRFYQLSTGLIKSFLWIQSVLFTLVAWGYFKWLVYGAQGWPGKALAVAIIISTLVKIFFPECIRIYSHLPQHYKKLEQLKFRPFIAHILMGLLIVSIVAVRDIRAVLANIFLTDHFHHLDTMLTSPVWAYLKGMTLDIDVFSHYAIGLPVVTAWVMKVLGGISYEHLLIWMIILTCVYYFIFFSFVSSWLNSCWLAGAATLLLIKWNMFNPSVTPLVFTYPSTTVIRYPLDIILIWIIWRGLSQSTWQNIVFGSLCAGFSLFYMIDSGIYMALTWFAFLMYSGWHSKEWFKSIGGASITIATAFILMLLVQREWLFTVTFWTNLSERTALFLAGHGNILMTKSLLDGKVAQGLMGFIIPVIYIAALIVPLMMYWQDKAKKQVMMISFIALYGLASYHYYVCRSADTSYHVVVMPLVLLLAFGFKLWVGHIKSSLQSLVALGAFVALFICLMTTHQALRYPNFWHLSASPIVRPQVPLLLEGKISFMNHHQVMWNPALKLPTNSLGSTDEDIRTEKDFTDDKALVKYFNEEFDFTQDAKLIKEFSNPDDHVALISSFETKILMQANRKPLFYYFPLVDSRPMHMRMFNMTALWTIERLNKTMSQLKEGQPNYIFLEKVLLAKSVPQAYQYLYPDLLVMLNYIDSNYSVVKEGKFLAALKLKQ